MTDKPTPQLRAKPDTSNNDPLAETADETAETVATTAYMPRSLHKRLRVYAVLTETSMTEHFRRAVEHYLDQNDA